MESSETQTKIYPECHWCAANVGRIALWGNIGLCVIKLLCGTAGDSSAVVADAVHSGADVLMAVILMICLRVSKSPPDKDHPYGHGNIEYIASLFVGLSLSMMAALIFYISVSDIAGGVTHQPSAVAFIALIISIVGNELMFRHSLCCGNRFGSPAMIANAWENRADVYSSLGALAGVAGAQMGLLFMDPVGAILVAVLIARSAIQMLHSAWRGILDHSLDDSMEDQICKLANADPEVERVASLRTRAMGPYMGVEIELAVSPDLTLGEGCEICERVKTALFHKIKRMSMIAVTPIGKDD